MLSHHDTLITLCAVQAKQVTAQPTVDKMLADFVMMTLAQTKKAEQVRSHLTCHTRTALSHELEAMRVLSDDQARADTCEECPP